MSEIDDLLERLKGSLTEREHELLCRLLNSYAYLTDLLDDKRTTIDHLRKLLFGATTEKTTNVVGKATGAGGPAPKETGEREKKPGHGRNGAEQYRGATKTIVAHESLHQGDRCPDCAKGKLYEQGEPKRLIRLFGQAPIGANIYELERLRCNLCGRVHVAKTPQGVGDEKYDATTASMIALLKYGAGVPFNRLEGIQRNAEIPLPASTQWEIVNEAAALMEPVFQEHIRQAAQGQVIHNDDTGMRVPALGGEDKRSLSPETKNESERTGVFTSGIVSITEDGRKIAIFFTGHQHAGENLKDVLVARAQGMEPAIQMCDALSRNMPDGLDVIIANCIAHARRKFVDVAPQFPDECRFVLEKFRDVYRIDAQARNDGLSARDRLALHKEHSHPVMQDLKAWCEEQFAAKKVEPNSRLGDAIRYLTKHWDRLTLFLRQPGAPLDNNICERALKKAILHRKNALFYKSERGAHVGDVFMTLIHTAELANVNVLGYLTAILKNSMDAQKDPGLWMPWNYAKKPELTDQLEAAS